MTARLVAVAGPSDPAVAAAARHLRAGGLVAFPTETVYGLGADATNPTACARVYAVKGRPADNPLIVHCASTRQALALVAAPGQRALALARRFWPGPLTLVLRPAPPAVAGACAGLDSVAVRVPAHPLAQALLRAAGVPVAAPSANLSSRPSATDAASVMADLEAAAAQGRDVSDVWVLDGGGAPHGVESTVIDLAPDGVRLLRAGALPVEAIEAVVGTVAAGGDARRSPGTRHRHYAPRLPLWLFGHEMRAEEVAAFVRARPGRVALMARPGALAALVAALGAESARVCARAVGREGDTDGSALAHDLFAALRWCDGVGADYALAELPEGGAGLYPAVRDRLLRASEGRTLAGGPRQAAGPRPRSGRLSGEGLA